MFISPGVGSPEAPPPAGSPLLGLGAGPALVTSLHRMVLRPGLHGQVKHGVLVSSTAIDHITIYALTMIQTALDDQFLKMDSLLEWIMMLSECLTCSLYRVWMSTNLGAWDPGSSGPWGG